MLANEITKFPFNAAEACLLLTMIVTKPAPRVTSQMTGSPALVAPFTNDAKTVSATRDGRARESQRIGGPGGGCKRLGSDLA